MDSGAVLLKLADVSKWYASAATGERLAILDHVDLEARQGESVAIIGPSGSGKSTLLNIIGTLDRPSSGQVFLQGKQVSGLSEADLAAVRNRQIGFIFQSHHLLPHCTVLENVLVPTLATNSRAQSHAIEKGRKLLERVGLGQRLDHRPGQLSGGERQRVAVVRALINDPKLLLADEPTGSLDRASAAELGQLLVDINREEHVTLILVTHAPELAQRMGRALELRERRLSSKS
jgi:lipoprotein-releasing system ATP-binding protein